VIASLETIHADNIIGNEAVRDCESPGLLGFGSHGTVITSTIITGSCPRPYSWRHDPTIAIDRPRHLGDQVVVLDPCATAALQLSSYSVALLAKAVLVLVLVAGN